MHIAAFVLAFGTALYVQHKIDPTTDPVTNVGFALLAGIAGVLVVSV